MPHLLAIGLGYVAEALAHDLARAGWAVTGTAQSPAGASRISALGFEGVPFADGAAFVPPPATTHLLLSAPPGESGDPVLVVPGDAIAALPALEWIGYLSTTSVYGNHDGAWVDEATPVAPDSKRGERRADAERAWLDFGETFDVQVQVFRLSGIYGPGRSAIDKIRDGAARAVIKPGQFFNRCHRTDIVNVLRASIAAPRAGAIYNVADDLPTAPEEVLDYAAELLGAPPVRRISIDSDEISAMARTFYGDNKRVRNDLIKRELGVRLVYPTYRDGLEAQLATEKNGGVGDTA